MRFPKSITEALQIVHLTCILIFLDVERYVKCPRESNNIRYNAIEAFDVNLIMTSNKHSTILSRILHALLLQKSILKYQVRPAVSSFGAHAEEKQVPADVCMRFKSYCNHLRLASWLFRVSLGFAARCELVLPPLDALV